MVFAYLRRYPEVRAPVYVTIYDLACYILQCEFELNTSCSCTMRQVLIVSFTNYPVFILALTYNSNSGNIMMISEFADRSSS